MQKLMYIISPTEDADLHFRIFYNLYGHSMNCIQMTACMQSSHLFQLSITPLLKFQMSMLIICFIQPLMLERSMAPSYAGDNPPSNPSLFIRCPQKQLGRHWTSKSTTLLSLTASFSLPAACDHILPLVLARFFQAMRVFCSMF